MKLVFFETFRGGERCQMKRKPKRVSEEALKKLNKVTQIAPKIPDAHHSKRSDEIFGKYDEARSLLESNEPSDDSR